MGLNNSSYGYGAITISLTSEEGGPINISSIGVGIFDEQISYIYNTDPPDVMHDSLSVKFSENAVVTSLSYLNLFANEGPSREPETAMANFGRTGPNTLIYSNGIATDGAGLYTESGLNETNFTEIKFTAEFGTYSDFALASIKIQGFDMPPSSPVPEPATIFILGTGLIGLAGWAEKV